MVRSSSDAKARRTKATTSQQGKQTGVKRGKTPDQKAKHRVSCQESRARIKNRNNQMREEYERMTKELEEKNSELLRFQNEMQKYKRAVEEQKEKEAQMWQFPTSLEIEGQSISSFEQMSNYLLSRPYEPNHQGLDNPNITASELWPSFDANNIGFYAPNNNISSCDPAAGNRARVPDFVAGSSFDANVDDEFFDWMEKLKFDTAAGISETTTLVFENQNNDLVNQNDHNAMVQRRDLSPTQRSAENERDRQDMPGHNMELERLRKVEAKYKEMVSLFNTISQLAEESKQMNDTEPYLARRIQEVDNIRQHIQEMHNKSFDHGSESSHTVMYTA